MKGESSVGTTVLVVRSAAEKMKILHRAVETTAPTKLQRAAVGGGLKVENTKLKLGVFEKVKVKVNEGLRREIKVGRET